MGDVQVVACVQMTSRADKAANLERAESLVAKAASAGATLVVLPEKWNAIGSVDDYLAAAEPLSGGETVDAMSSWARTLGITLVGGSICERREGRSKCFNTSCVFDPTGVLCGVYRKIHLFDVEVGGHVYRESDSEDSGDEPVVAKVGRRTIGLTVCYDLRFPELFRILALAGADLITVPAHFTTPTGRDHWHVLLRARAIENQLYVAAAGQFGETIAGRPAYGRSIIVDPWGTVLAQAPDGEGIIVAEIDTGRMRQIRESLPSLASRRPDVYELAVWGRLGV